jgi:hypothetical protein
MKKFVALMAVVATAGLLAACQPGKPINATAYEGHMSSSGKSSSSTAGAPMAADKSGRTFKAQ